MTAVLDEIRALEAARDRGDLDERTFAAAKRQVLDDIEDALDADAQPGLARPIIAAIFALLVGTAVGTVLFGDVLLAATAAIMIMAAFAVNAFRRLG